MTIDAVPHPGCFLQHGNGRAWRFHERDARGRNVNGVRVLLVSHEPERRWGGLTSGRECVQTSTLVDAKVYLSPGVSLVVTDVRLADDNCTAMLEQARSLEPPPTVVILQGDLPAEFVAQLIEAHTRTRAEPGPESSARTEDGLIAAASLEVGRLGVREAQDVVRRTMYAEALARTNGSRKAAARLLKVDRKAVQRIAADLDAV
jgi:DNA-binding NtrC family response regulator